MGGAKMAHMVDPANDCTSSWSTSIDGPEFQHIQFVIDSLPGELSVVERREAIELLQTYQDVFSKSEYDLCRGLTWESVLVYIDDIVVYAHTYSDLKLRLEEVFISNSNPPRLSSSRKKYSSSDTVYPAPE